MDHHFFTQKTEITHSITMTSLPSSHSKRKKSHHSRESSSRGEKENHNNFNLPDGKYSAPDYQKLIGERLKFPKKTYERKKRMVEDRPLRCLSPLSTEGMVMKQIELNKKVIVVDQEGITIKSNSDMMTISPDGTNITLSKDGKQCKYTLRTLP